MYVTFTGFRYDDLVTSHSAAVAKLEHSQVIFQVLQIMGISLMYVWTNIYGHTITYTWTDEYIAADIETFIQYCLRAFSCIQVNK